MPGRSPSLQARKQGWSTDSSRALYRLAEWGQDYFDINEQGHLILRCGRHTADVHTLVQGLLREQGHRLPLLIRCRDILQAQVSALHRAFQQAMQEHDYSGSHTLVYPIKVNQQRTVIETIVEHPLATGLEAGSKPELLMVLALAPPGSVVICNGHKDRQYIRLALIGCCMGLDVQLVIDKPAECERIIRGVQQSGIRPVLGLRIKLHAIADGNWQNSGGVHSKFGLGSRQILAAVHQLREAGLLDCLRLMHFHIGSQIPRLADFQGALREAAHYYIELRRLGVPLDTVDVGGGLGIDYEGSHSTAPCSSNYSWHDYADSIIRAFRDLGETAPCPDIITESGRAITAHHALLISNVAEMEAHTATGAGARCQAAPVLALRRLLHESLSPGELRQQAGQRLEEARELFSAGRLRLQELAEAENLYYRLCQTPTRDDDPALQGPLAAIWVCNFSLFRSLPDSWAIDQVFPIMPIHRLHQAPGREVTIHDLSCDSDGRISHYVTSAGLSRSLPVPETAPGEEQLIGIFLLGAYQEVLGDIHNLFGATGSVMIALNGEGGVVVQDRHDGDQVSDLLRQVGMDTEHIRQRYRQRIAAAALPAPRRRQYLDELLSGLDGYSYLEIQGNSGADKQAI